MRNIECQEGEKNFWIHAKQKKKIIVCLLLTKEYNQHYPLRFNYSLSFFWFCAVFGAHRDVMEKSSYHSKCVQYNQPFSSEIEQGGHWPLVPEITILLSNYPRQTE